MTLLHVLLIKLLTAGHCDVYLDVHSWLVQVEQSATSTAGRLAGTQLLGGVIQQAQLQV